MRGHIGIRKNLEKLLGHKIEEVKYFKVDSLENYQRFVLELLYTTNTHKHYSMAHYYECNGDLVSDPDVTFAIDSNGEIFPQSFQNSIYFDDRYFNLETKKYCPAKCRELMAFLTMWTTNLLRQGYHREVPKITLVADSAKDN